MGTGPAHSLEEMLDAADAPTLNEAGNAFADRGMWNEALECYERSLTLHRQAHNQRGEALVLNNLGATCYAMGDWPTALTHYEDALTILRRLDDRQIELLTLMNVCFLKYAQDRDCGEDLNRAQRLAEEMGQKEALTRICWMRGDAALREGSDLPAAFRHYALACLHAQSTGGNLLDATLDYIGEHLRALASQDKRLAALAFCDYLLAFGRAENMGRAFLARLEEMRTSLISPPLLGM